jgi:hypothetical protein
VGDETARAQAAFGEAAVGRFVTRKEKLRIPGMHDSLRERVRELTSKRERGEAEHRGTESRASRLGEFMESLHSKCPKEGKIRRQAYDIAG